MFLFQLILFILVSILLFTLPGIYLLQKSKALNGLEKIILGTILGFVIFTLVSYFLGLLKITFLLLPIVTILDFLFLKNSITINLGIKLLPRKQFLILVAIFILGIAGQLAIIAPSGIYKGGDLVFWSSNGHDGSWHIALMEEIKKGYPLKNPSFAQEKLVNYHFFSDIAPAEFNAYFKLPPLDLYFRFFPILYSFLLGSVAYLFGKKMGGSFAAGAWSTFFVYFAGSFGYIVTWIQNHKIGGESIFWATQIQSSIGNPPQIISNILVLTFLYLFSVYLSKKNWSIFLLCLALLGSLVEFKVYAAMVVLASLVMVGLIQLIKDRGFSILSLFTLSSLLAALLYFPNASKSTSFLIWEPWWFIRTMIVVPSRLNWLDLELKRQTYMAEGNFKRVLQIELTGFLIFFFGNLGTRFLGLILLLKLLKHPLQSYLNQMFLLIITTSLVAPLLFLQKGVASNTIQFLQYFLLLFGVLAAITLAQILNKFGSVLLKILLVIVIILLSVPTQVGLLYDFYHKPPLAKITSEEIKALNFLKENSNSESVILTPPYNKYLDLKIPTPDIWAWFDTSYVSALTARRTYLADTEQIDIMGYDFKNRLKLQQNIFEETDPNIIYQQMKKANITYLYFPRLLKPKANLDKSNLKLIYSNSKVEIWVIK